MPKRFAADPEGQNLSPPLAWSGVPPSAKELVVIVEDAPPLRKAFVNWVLYGIPASVRALPEGIPADQGTANGFVQGTNDFGHLGWGGPLPLAGEGWHRYTFWVYAVDMHVKLEPGASKAEVIAAISRHILSNGRMIGTYRR